MDKLHFDDLTKIICPLGLLPKETKDALRGWPHGWEFFSHNGEWVLAPHPAVWQPSVTYRARPAPLTQDVIPWDALADWVKWVARDSDGKAWAFEAAPEPGRDMWLDGTGKAARIGDLLKGYQRGTVDWKDSLQQRPEGV